MTSVNLPASRTPVKDLPSRRAFACGCTFTCSGKRLKLLKENTFSTVRMTKNVATDTLQEKQQTEILAEWQEGDYL